MNLIPTANEQLVQPRNWRLPTLTLEPTGNQGQYGQTGPTVTEDPETAFARLAQEWKRDTAHLSVLSQRLQHPSYRAIVSMGRTAIPLILSDLERDPDHWFHALFLLTGANPIPHNFGGSVTDAIQLWIDWGRQQRYLPDANQRFVRNIP